MAKKIEKVIKTKKVVSKKKSVRTPRPKTKIKISKNGLLALLIGLAVVVGVMAYKSMGYQASPVDIMVVDQPTSFSVYDRFGDGVINKGDWRVNKAERVEIIESKADNLKMIIPNGAVGSKVRTGSIVHKENVSAATDFSAATRMYKPNVSADGVGRSGIRFVGGDGEEAEGVSVYWEVGKGVSELVFSVTAKGEGVKSQRVSVEGKQVQLVLKRTGNEYLAAYRMDTFDDDNAFEELGDSVSSAFSTGGKLRLFANNGGADGKYPRTVARFDNVSLKSNPDNTVLRDNFGGEGALDTSIWNISTKGAGGSLNKKDGNLIMSLPSATKPTEGEFVNNVIRATSTAEISKDTKGVAIADFYKPKIIGSGVGVVGLSFNSESDKNNESASIQWVVSENSSKLVFAVRNTKGNVVERNSVNIPRGRNRVSLRLMHGEGVYRATYRLGPGLDDDNGFKNLGSLRNEKLGDKGYFSVYATHRAAAGVAPELSVRLDSFRVSYY